MFEIREDHCALVLAPMEGITDAPMRSFLSERGGFTHCVSEFLRVSQEVPPHRTLLEHVPELRFESLTPSQVPVQVQLLGGNAERLALTAQRACELGTRSVDLNFGCPAPTVNRHDGGATLLKYPDRIFEIVSAVRAAVPATIPVSAKLRLGWDDMQAIHQNSEAAASGGATWIAIHGRTKVQGYTPPAYWKPIGEVRARLGIPVIANGEIWTLDDFKRCRDETQCKHYMLGRGALANPQLVTQIAVELGLLKKSAANDEEELAGEKRRWYPLLLRFAEISEKFANRSDYTACRIKQWLRIASHRRQIAWFDEIKRLQGYQEILKWLA